MIKLNEALKAAVIKATVQQCQTLEGFIGAVGVTAVKQDLSDGRVHRMDLKTEEKHLFAVRLLIDASLGLQMTVTSVDGRQPRKLRHEALRAFKVPVWTKAKGNGDKVSVFERFHEIVRELAMAVYDEETVEPPPDPDPESKPAHVQLIDYCQTLNAELYNLNGETRHCFAYALYKEPVSVRRLIETHLSNLRLFLLACKGGEEPLTLKAVDLEVWLSRSFKLVEQCRAQPKPTLEPHIQEEAAMPSKKAVQQQGGDNSPQVSVIGDGASIHIHGQNSGNSNQLDQLLAVLEQIEKRASRDVPMERQVQADAQIIRRDYKEQGRLTTNGLAWLLASLDPGIKLGKDLLGLVTQAVNLWPKKTEDDSEGEE
ncbi:MAG: hypothetical protein ABW148_17765 [Sedimenticola sp.]